MRTLNRAIIVMLLSAAVSCQKRATQPQLVGLLGGEGGPTPALIEPSTNPAEPTTEPTASITESPTMPAGEPTPAPTTPSEPTTAPTVEATPPTPPVVSEAPVGPVPELPTPNVVTAPAQPAPVPEIPATIPFAETTSEAPPTTSVAGPPPFNPAPPTTKPSEVEADKILAERLSAQAQSLLLAKPAVPEQWPPMLRQSGALLQAAVKLDSANPRFSRLLTDVMVDAGDTDGAIAALQATRKADPRDEFAQVQLIDLYASRMQTAGEKIEYLKGVLGVPTGVPESVRSHAGVMATRLLLDRGEEQTARKVLGESLRLNPLSLEGLAMRYDMLAPTASAFERAAALMAIMKSNPTARNASLPGRPFYAELLGDQFADSGLVADSIPWYELTLKLSLFNPDLNVAVKLAAQQFINDQLPEAMAYTQKVTEVDSNNTSAWFLKLAILHSLGNQEDYNKALQQARNVIANQLVEISNAATGESGTKAATRPITSEGAFPLPDLRLTVAQINRGGATELRQAFVEAVSRLAMLEVYFAQQPDNAARLIDLLKSVQPDDDPTVARLLGWQYLLQDKREEARVKFLGIAAQDPMANLGLVRLERNEQDAASMGRKLIADHSSGLVGAILWDALRPLKVKIVTNKQADALKQIGDQFPKEWLSILERPAVQRDRPTVDMFYGISVTPFNVARAFGEPMLARMTITNLTDSDLTIGPDGLLKRDVWFNAQVKGIVEQSFPVTAVERIAGPLVLRGRQLTTQVIRLDRGPLRQFLESEPRVAFDVYGTAMTNPMSLPNGTIDSGPGGYTVKFSKVFGRSAAPTDGPAPQRAIKDLSDGTPTQKMNAIALLQSFAGIIYNQKEDTDAVKQAKQAGKVMVNWIFKTRKDPVPAVSAVAGWVTGRMVGGEAGAGFALELAVHQDWRHRLMALLIDTVSLDAQREIATRLSVDPEPSVRALAQSRVELIEIKASMPTTQSTTQSTTQPTPTTQP